MTRRRAPGDLVDRLANYRIIGAVSARRRVTDATMLLLPSLAIHTDMPCCARRASPVAELSHDLSVLSRARVSLPRRGVRAYYCRDEE